MPYHSHPQQQLVSNDIQDKEKVAEKTQQEIDEARVGYKPCGAYNAILFFCIRDMAGEQRAGRAVLPVSAA